MELIADRGRRVTVEELNTTRLLAHAKKQAQQRKFDDILIVDVDAHHYENECMDDILPFLENDVIRQLAIASRAKGRGSLVPNMAVGFQDMGGRITRYPLRSSEKTEKGKMRDVQLGHRWMDAMSVDYSCLFPTLMLAIGLHPDSEMEVELCWAYNRWLTEKALPESDGRFYSMLSLPLSEPDAAMRQIETFAGRKGVTGFMITSVRGQPVHHNRHMKVFRALEERGLPLAFHSAINPMEPVFKTLNRFASVHGLGFPFYNILHMTNWVTNGIGERFPKLQRDLDRRWARLDPVPDAAARPRVHAAPVGISAVEEEAVRLHARHVLRVAADGDRGQAGARMHLPHDQCGNAAPLRLRLSALGFRPAVVDLGPAVPLGEGQAQHPRRQRRAPVQAAAAQREAEREPPPLRQSRGVKHQWEQHRMKSSHD